MASQDPQLSKNSTIYSYRLMMRIHHSAFKIIFHFGVLVLIFTFAAWNGMILGLLFSYPIVLLAHAILVAIYFRATRKKPIKGWSFRLDWLWSGILPEAHVPLGLVDKLHQQLFWIGLVLITGLFPWISSKFFMNLTLMHLWLLAPRLWIIFRFRAYRHSGLLKINKKDTSCYLP
jgi:hypothetical protein